MWWQRHMRRWFVRCDGRNCENGISDKIPVTIMAPKQRLDSSVLCCSLPLFLICVESHHWLFNVLVMKIMQSHPTNWPLQLLHRKKCGVSEHRREQYFYVSMVTHTVTMETGKYCSPGAFSYTTFFTVLT